MWEGDGEAQGLEEEEGEYEKEGEVSPGYSDVTVREAVEWTMSRDSEFTYIDIRSAEEHGKLATVRCVNTNCCIYQKSCSCLYTQVLTLLLYYCIHAAV